MPEATLAPEVLLVSCVVVLDVEAVELGVDDVVLAVDLLVSVVALVAAVVVSVWVSATLTDAVVCDAVSDDDVAVMPEAIERLAKWTGSHDVIQGSRYDYDGGPFYWQYDFIVPLGIPNPIAPAAFGPAGYRVMDTLCFEGGLFRRNIVEKIGLPDPRFFIYWDDTMYGYRASKVTNPIVVPDVVLRRTREIGNWDIAGVRQLNSTSDMNRYHIMRNRGYMARYFMTYGDYRPLLFGLGTVLTAVKEVIRLTMVDREHFKTGIVQIAKGWWDSRKLLHDPEWQPMPPLK